MPDLHQSYPKKENRSNSVGGNSKYKELLTRYGESEVESYYDDKPRVLDDVSNLDDLNHLTEPEDDFDRNNNNSPAERDCIQTDINTLPHAEAMPIRTNNFQCFNINVEKTSK